MLPPGRRDRGEVAPRRRQTILRIGRSPLLALGLALLLGGAVSTGHARAAAVYTYNTYHSAGYLTQDPYYSACVAASTQMMLNFTAQSGAGGAGFRWTPSTAKNRPNDTRDMTSIFAYARAHDTLSSAGSGSDPHGWRNALNYYGWGSAALAQDKRIYDDRAYRSYDSAIRAAVIAIARYHKPVGMLAWAGGHAQVITGYQVTGEDPAISTNFTVNSVYLSDPLASDSIVNKKVSYDTLRSGSTTLRFRPYSQTDSPYDDPYTAGWIRSSVRSGPSEWFGRYILVIPIRNGLPG